jgi:DNA-nicking Smr family endonuclease
MRAKKPTSEIFPFQPFEDLKKIIDRKGMSIARKPPATKKAVQPADEEVFHEAMREVREIKEFRRLPVLRRKETALRRKISPEREAVKALEEIISGKRAMHLPDTQEYVEWVNEDCRGNVIRILHEGKFSVQDCLDLHGFCVEEAENAVGHFLKESRLKGHRCIKIIHGRGLRSPNGPLLKQAVIRWLSGRHRKNIVAFVTARQCDGGLGALYVLLR